MKQIERSQFNDLREKVSELGKTTPKELKIKKVREDGTFFPCNNHNVTGTEFNDVTKKVQESFMEVNGYVQELYNGFKIVAQTFETLDKNYVATLLYNLEETNKASNNAFKASEKALQASSKADISIAELRDLQQQLRRTVEAISSKLAEHRQQLENFSQKHARLSEEVRENKVKHNNERLEIKRSISKLETSVSANSADLVELDANIVRFEEKCKAFEKATQLTISKIDEKLSELSKHANNVNTLIESLQTSLLQKEQTFELHSQQLEEVMRKQTSLSEEVSHNKERQQKRQEELKELLDKLKGKSQTLSSDLVEIDEKVAKLEVQREKAVKQSLEFEEQIQQLAAQNQRLEAELQTMADEKDKASFFNVPNVASFSALLLVVLHFILNLCGVV